MSVQRKPQNRNRLVKVNNPRSGNREEVSRQLKRQRDFEQLRSERITDWSREGLIAAGVLTPKKRG